MVGAKKNIAQAEEKQLKKLNEAGEKNGKEVEKQLKKLNETGEKNGKELLQRKDQIKKDLEGQMKQLKTLFGEEIAEIRSKNESDMSQKVQQIQKSYQEDTEKFTEQLA